jgi:hypothetical protein
MTVIRDLTDAEFTAALGFCRKLIKKQGFTQFSMSCEQLAKSKYLTRGQFEKLKEAATSPGYERRDRPRRAYQQKSKRPITLPSLD